MMRVISFKIDEETLWKLDLLAKANNMSRSELIRRAIMALLEPEYKMKLLYPVELLDPEEVI